MSVCAKIMRRRRQPLNSSVRPRTMRYATLATVLILASPWLLFASESYRGDGTLTDAGPASAHERYVLDLGAVSLAEANRKAFKMLGLPSAEFTLGLRPVNVSNGCNASALEATRVRLNVQTDSGEVVVSEEGPLNSWVTSPHLVYRKGTEVPKLKAGGAVEYVQTGVRAHGGWGTYFAPKTSTTYLASFEVLEPHGTSFCESRLVLIGGGWK